MLLRQSGVDVPKRHEFEFSTFWLFIIVTRNRRRFPSASTKPQTVPPPPPPPPSPPSSSSSPCFSVVLPIDLVVILRSDASPLWAFSSAMRSPDDLDLAMLNARSWSVLAFAPAQYAQHLHQYQMYLYTISSKKLTTFLVVALNKNTGQKNEPLRPSKNCENNA